MSGETEKKKKKKKKKKKSNVERQRGHCGLTIGTRAKESSTSGKENPLSDVEN